MVMSPINYKNAPKTHLRTYIGLKLTINSVCLRPQQATLVSTFMELKFVSVFLSHSLVIGQYD